MAGLKTDAPFTDNDYKGEFNLLKAEKELIIKVGKMVKGKRNTIALIMGISERTVIRRIKQHSIDKQTFHS